MNINRPLLHLGFTGTRHGLTDPQRATLSTIFSSRGPGRLHHGDCVGADEQCSRLARKLGWHPQSIHPPENDMLRAFCATAADALYDPAPYLARNRSIVDSSHELLACPNTHRPARRSGTWYTITYAISHSIPVTIIFPDGSTEHTPHQDGPNVL